MGHLAFPDFEEGSHLNELVTQIALALGTIARKRVGLSLELLVGFKGYPEQFQLWWDGFTCELGCSEPCGVDMDEVSDRLLGSGAFAPSE